MLTVSITSESNRNAYLGDGATDTYTYSFKIFSATDLDVKIEDDEGEITTLVYPTDFTITGVGLTTGGTITLTAGDLDAGFKIVIRRIRPITQTTSIRNETTYYASTHENTFDKLVMIDQQQQEQIDRSLKLADTAIASEFDPTLPALLEANHTLVVNSTGNGLALGPTPDQLSGALDNVTAAEAAQAAAEAAQAAAEEARTAAEAAVAGAEAAKSGAEAAQGAAETAQSAAETARDEAVAAALDARGFVGGGPLTVASGTDEDTGEAYDEAENDAIDYIAWVRGTSIRSRYEFSVIFDGANWAYVPGPERHFDEIASVFFSVGDTATGEVNIENTGGVDVDVTWQKIYHPTP